MINKKLICINNAKKKEILKPSIMIDLRILMINQDHHYYGQLILV